MAKVALITGIGGQDGSYLAELLIKKKYKIYGIHNFKKNNNYKNLEKLENKIIIKKVDINNYTKIKNIIKSIKPNEVYHLAAQSFVNYKFEDEFFKLNPNINGTHYILSAIKEFSPKSKFYFAASSEVFGNAIQSPQNESTPFNPRSAYGISKVAGFYLTKNYREAHKLFACSGILFNHESPRRNEKFVTRKITKNLSLIMQGIKKKIILGNLNSKRDWGHSKDYAIGIWKILQYRKAEDFVLSTGRNVSVEEFIKKVFKILNLDWKKFVTTNNKKFLRPSEVRNLKGDSRKARKLLKWKPRYNLDDICKDMLEADLKLYGMTLKKAKEIAKKIKS